MALWRTKAGRNAAMVDPMARSGTRSRPQGRPVPAILACALAVVASVAARAELAWADPSALPAGAPVLALPLDCQPHKTCYIQSYVDRDPATGPTTDYACGSATYDGHSGVDFRLASTADAARGVAVLAAADGVVKSLRDGVADAIFQPTAGDAGIKGRECGNGVVLDHGNGWETQYCHLKQGSVRVAKGQVVTRGTGLGDVGYSGMASFAHVHLSVRHNDRVIDPFLPAGAAGSCTREGAGAGLWEPSVAAAFTYRNGEILGSGFAGAPVDHNALEVDHVGIVPLGLTSPALIFYARMMNLRAGDRIRITITGPGGALAESLSAPLDRSKATYTSFAGKKRGPTAWASGRYEGQVELLRDGSVIASTTGTVTLR